MEKERNFEETLRTPKQINDAGILSKNVQLKERKAGRLKYYQIGKKILYSEQHLRDYLTSCEQNAQTAEA